MIVSPHLTHTAVPGQELLCIQPAKVQEYTEHDVPMVVARKKTRISEYSYSLANWLRQRKIEGDLEELSMQKLRDEKKGKE